MSSYYDGQESDGDQPARQRHDRHNAVASSSRAGSVGAPSLAESYDDRYSAQAGNRSAGPSRGVNGQSNHDRSYSLISETSPSRTDRTPYSFEQDQDDESMVGDEDDAYDRRRGEIYGENGTGNGRHQGDLDMEMEEDENDVNHLGRVWVKERGTVDILQWEGDLMDLLFDKLEQQQKMVQTLRFDPQTSEEEHFKLMLVQTEMERIKFLIRSYVRTRLHKIEKYSHYIVLHPEVHHLLSGAELQHAKRYTELLHTHYQHSVLDSLPEWLQKMDDSYGDGLSMVTKPNLDTPVLIYCRKDCGEIVLEGGERAALARGSTHLVKYWMVEQWIKLGWAEVL